MALKAILSGEEFDTLTDTTKGFYKKSEGSDEAKAYVLDAEGVEDVGGLKSALKSERDLREAAERKYREDIVKYKDIDPEKYREAVAKIQEIEEAALQEAGQFEELKSRLRQEKDDAIATVRSDLGSKLEKTTDQLYKVMVANQLSAEFARQGGIADATELFLESAGKNVSVSGEDFSVKIPDGYGNSIAEYVDNLKKTNAFGVFFEADVPTGSGASTQHNRGGNDSSVKKASEMSTQEKAAFIRENGLDAWQAHLKKT